MKSIEYTFDYAELGNYGRYTGYHPDGYRIEIVITNDIINYYVLPFIKEQIVHSIRIDIPETVVISSGSSSRGEAKKNISINCQNQEAPRHPIIIKKGGKIKITIINPSSDGECASFDHIFLNEYKITPAMEANGYCSIEKSKVEIITEGGAMGGKRKNKRKTKTYKHKSSKKSRKSRRRTH